MESAEILFRVAALTNGMARGLKSGATVPVVISDYSPSSDLSDESDSWSLPHKGNALRFRCFFAVLFFER